MSDHPTRPLPLSEKLDWLRLIRSENVGPITFFRLMERFGSAGAALHALPDLAKKGGRGKSIKVCPKAKAERELDAIADAGGALVAWGEPDYPPRLGQVEDPPPLLIVLGHVHLLRKAAVAVVGARNASLNGTRLARELAAGLGSGGMLVISGLARGIDAAAHEGALATGTVAVVGGGADVVYPKENQDLRQRILEQGALISEVPLGTVPQARHFPRRNRLISGMARGVVVVEATEGSGSLITAHLALEQGREVFAVPGSPKDARARGPNELIRQGAILTENAQDVLKVLARMSTKPLEERRDFDFSAEPLPPAEIVERERERIIDLLGPSPVEVDDLIRACSSTTAPAVVSLVLLELELAGRLERHPGNRVALLD